MICEKCGCDRVNAVLNTTTNIQSGRGLFSILGNLLLVALTCGLWLIVIIIRGSKISGGSKTKTMWVCQCCGHAFTGKHAPRWAKILGLIFMWAVFVVIVIDIIMTYSH